MSTVAKTEVVVFRYPQFPAAGEAWQWQIDGQPVARAREFRYLGVICMKLRVSLQPSAPLQLQLRVPPGP